MNEHEEQRRVWHINREIGVGDLVAIATALVAVVISYSQLDARVKVVEVITATNTAQITNTVAEIKNDMRRLADRIEKIVDNHNGDLASLKKGK